MHTEAPRQHTQHPQQLQQTHTRSIIQPPQPLTHQTHTHLRPSATAPTTAPHTTGTTSSHQHHKATVPQPGRTTDVSDCRTIQSSPVTRGLSILQSIRGRSPSHLLLFTINMPRARGTLGHFRRRHHCAQCHTRTPPSTDGRMPHHSTPDSW